GEKKSPPRGRHDSDDESDSSDGDARRARRRRRHDSSDASSNGDGNNKPEAVKSSSRRRRHDSDASGDSNARPEPVKSSSSSKRRRHDSDSDNSSVRKPDTSNASSSKRRRYDSDSEDPDNESRERMSSGHKAGLQGYRDFNKSEKKIQQRKHQEAQQMVDKYGMGETVYRDKDGRRAKASDRSAEPVEDPAEVQRKLNQGKVQREALEQKAEEMARLSSSTFARRQDDDYLEEQRKNEIRQDDPMAHYAFKKQKKGGKSGSSTSSAPSRPVYKGPPPKPNRYGIRPGYRWDGIDRGNSFEDKILAQKFNAQHKEERAYRWRSADM
ncbi:MAG: hypothetical protein SGILL_009669, partial [Bacillariaceae sp.]